MATTTGPFGSWLRQRRKALDLTQIDLAERVGCSQDTIQKIEAGYRRPSKQVTALLLDALRVPKGDRDAYARWARGAVDSSEAVEEAGRGAVDASSPATSGNAAMPSAMGHAGNVPVPLTPLLGRKQTLAEIIAMLLGQDVRLLTLTGPPGIGKTRLGLQVARDLSRHFTDGVCFVALGVTADPALVVANIQQALGRADSGAGGMSLLDHIARHLDGKQLLLLLDNFEQVVAAREQVVELLTRCEGLKVLITSREALQAEGEWRYAVPTLELPDMADLPTPDALLTVPAVALFVARATAVKSNFQLSSENAQAVAAICTRLDGLPLAIELAATRISVLPPELILKRIDQRFKLLTGGARYLPSRQQTLRGAIDWSYDALAPDEQQLFRRLGVFSGNFTMHAIEGVCGDFDDAGTDALTTVTSLVDKSLLTREEPAEGQRFTMLQTIHEYAWEKLEESGESVELADRHSDFFLELAEAAEKHYNYADELRWLNIVQLELDNCRAALGRAVNSGNSEVALRFVAALGPFWHYRNNYSEGRSWAEKALALADGTLRSSSSSPGPEQVTAWARALFAAGRLAYFQGDLAAARRWLEQSQARCETTGYTVGFARALLYLGAVELQTDEESARRMFSRSMQLFEQEGDNWGLALSLNMQGEMARMHNELNTAQTFYRRSLSILRSIDSRSLLVGMMLGNLARVAQGMGDHGQALQLFLEAMKIFQEVTDKRLLAGSLAGVAASLAKTGKSAEAACLFGAAEGIWENIGSTLVEVPDRYEHEHSMAAARQGAGESAWQAAWRRGHSMQAESAVQYALEQLGPAELPMV